MKKAILTALILCGAYQPATAKPRVASINMCTDQLLLALADPEQIVGLSPIATTPSMSWYAEKAKGYPILSGQAEDVLPLKPDFVLTATFVKTTTRAMLRRHNLPVIELPPANTINDVKTQIRHVGALLEQSTRAEAAISEIDASIEETRTAISDKRLRVLPLARRGWISGENTLLNEILERSGLTNLGVKTGKDGGRLSLEAIIALKPDRLLAGGDWNRAEDQGTALLQHPALKKIVSEDQRMLLPSRMTVCAGPMLADAFRLFAKEIKH